ncbi:MAG TPA: exodeoxyribonuclease III [Gammaproteobacteria bacterium]|nr:exodeoxyribonuclease III [Gammaproteobacteria bacterium]
MLSVATWNVNSIKARLNHVLQWCAQTAPDVLAIQETKTVDTAFPREALAPLGYVQTILGQPSYNGVAILSRSAPREIVTALPNFIDEQRRVLGVAFEEFFLLNLYVPNGSAVGTEKYAYKLAWLDALIAWLPEILKAHPKLLVVGDFNVAPEDRDVHDPDAWRGQVLCSEPERARIKAMEGLGLRDLFREFEPAGGHYTWWDYRAAAFRRNLGLRIDLALGSPALVPHCRGVSIDRAPRKWDKPSDHAPVLIRLDFGA